MEYLVQINDARFRLPDARARDRVRSFIEAAVRAAGGFVTIGHVDGETEVLVTANSSVRIDEAPTIAPVAVIAPQGQVAEDLAYLEFELYGGL